MEKKILAAASAENQKYFINPEFDGLPQDIITDIRILCVSIAEKIHGLFTIGFYQDGSMFFEAKSEGDGFEYDEIGVPLEIQRVKTEQKKLIAALQLWYQVKFLINNPIQ